MNHGIPCGSSAKERLEDLPEFIGFEANAFVKHRNKNFRPSLLHAPVESDAHPTAFASILDGVTDEVLEALLQAGLIGQNRRHVRLDLLFDGKARAFDHAGRLRERVGYHLVGLDRAKLVARAGLGGGEQQDLLHHVGQAPRLAAYGLAVLPDGRSAVNQSIRQVVGR